MVTSHCLSVLKKGIWCAIAPSSGCYKILQLFSIAIAKTQFLKPCSISENIKHKTLSSSTIYKTSDSSCKMKLSSQNSFTCVQNQTLLSKQFYLRSKSNTALKS